MTAGYKANPVFVCRGNADELLSEERYVGPCEISAQTNGRLLVMRPVDVLIAENERSRDRGLPEIQPLSRVDLALRRLCELTKRDSAELLSVGSVRFKSRGWGRTWENFIEKELTT